MEVRCCHARGTVATTAVGIVEISAGRFWCEEIPRMYAVLGKCTLKVNISYDSFGGSTLSFTHSHRLDCLLPDIFFDSEVLMESRATPYLAPFGHERKNRRK